MYVVTIDSPDGDGLSLRCETMKKVFSALELFLQNNNQVVIKKERKQTMYTISYARDLLSSNWYTEDVPELELRDRVFKLTQQGYKILPPEPRDEEEE